MGLNSKNKIWTGAYYPAQGLQVQEYKSKEDSILYRLLSGRGCKIGGGRRRAAVIKLK
jgi:hypothetical protein